MNAGQPADGTATASADTAGQECYVGYLQHEGERIEVEFVTALGASKQEKDSAFVDALSQVANIDFVAIGVFPANSTPKDSEDDWATRMCGRLDIDLWNIDESPGGIGMLEWSWSNDKRHCSTADLRTRQAAADDAMNALFPTSDWAREVAAGATRLGYQAWVEHQIDAQEGGRHA
jgi:hypothetical protein